MTSTDSPTPGEMRWQELGSLTVPFEPSETFAEDESSQMPVLASKQSNNAPDQAVSRLNAAAHWIAQGARGEKRFLRSRSARLKPLRDISSDIQRGSTPHPLVKPRSAFDTQPEGIHPSGAQLAQQLSQHKQPNDEEEDEPEQELWKDSTDPLVARTRPTRAEAAQIEQADIQRIELEEHVTLLHPVLKRARRRLSFWHFTFGGMVILALLVLAIDGFLLFAALHNATHQLTAGGGPPALSLSTNTTNTDTLVSVQMAHFAPGTTVALTHDVQETLFTTNNASLLTISASGQASASFSVNADWSPGFHLIVAEDVATRDTASAMLQVSGAGPSRPPHLLLDSSSLDLGNSVQGADTIQPLLLRNSGSGSISWSASSDQPWLLLAPSQGTFSSGQTISVAAQRSNLPPGEYKSTITLFSSVGAPAQLRVNMKVSALPLNAGPMISLVPPLLSFTTTDGAATPVTQVVTLSNPGQQVLHWSLNSGATTTTIMQNAFLGLPRNQRTAQDAYALPVINTSWLSVSQTSGSLAPGQSIHLPITVRSQNLLPGAYMEMLTFSSAHGTRAYDAPQSMGIALTIQPHCGLLTSTSNLIFTAVAGQSNPSNHALSLNATSSCANETLNWQAASSAGWLMVSPASGQVKGTASGVTSIGVNTALLTPGKYSGLVTFLAGKSSQTVTVQLTLQPPPPPPEPIMGASPLSLNFSTIQGQTSPAGQVITITNNGGSPLRWHTSAAQFTTNWVSATPTSGTVLPGQTGQMTVNVATGGLTPGNYVAQVTFNATDGRGLPASGSPQTIEVNLAVQPPCTLAQPSQSTLLFSMLAGGANPLAQTVNLTGTGSCSWPLHWNTSVSPAASWLTLTPGSGQLTAASQNASITVGINASGLQPGTYSAQVTIHASDSVGMQAQNSPQTFAVTLTVLQPCTLQPLPPQLNLSASQGQATPASQTFTLNETGSCGGGVAWTALGDAGSKTWLNLFPGSGTDNGGGSTVTVSASAGSLAPGSYTGQITVSASYNGVVLQGSPQTITVVLQVTGNSISGSVAACGASSCTNSSPLAGATVSLISGGPTIKTVTTDATGNFIFTNVPQGGYTIQVSGSANSLSYSGSATVTVSSTTTSVFVQTFSS